MLRFFSGTKLFLSIFFLGSSVFASSGEDYFSDNVVTEKKDISVFVTKLSERLQGVFKEIISLSADQSFFADVSNSQEETSKTLIDTEGHLYAPEILALAKLGVIDANREKFYPDNYLRRYELVMMLVKYRIAKENKQLSPVVFPLRGRFFDVAQNTSYAPYVAYAEQQKRIDQLISQKDGKKIFSPNKFLTKAEVCTMLNLDLSHAFCTEDRIKRGEFVAVLYRGFRNFEEDKNQLLESSSPKTQQAIDQPLISQVKTMFSLVTSQ
ncbi:hypothetical protein P148_SR1C00001G0713 [candidate division SR1 bacterium RAAC1_SR1_1]|nr:hypothetical protein P148_SR1C00001G0713 [candidate division SR1 bacterium RAAC1_SR1_1]